MYFRISELFEVRCFVLLVPARMGHDVNSGQMKLPTDHLRALGSIAKRIETRHALLGFHRETFQAAGTHDWKLLL